MLRLQHLSGTFADDDAGAIVFPVAMRAGSIRQQYEDCPLHSSWTLLAGVVRPKNPGQIRLTGPYPLDRLQIHDNIR